MKFKQGQSGNIEGRPKGAKNKIGIDLRERIIDFLSNEFQNIEDDMRKLPPRDRIKLYVDLLQYGLPKLQGVTIENEFDKLTDIQLDEIINRLKQSVQNEN